MYRSFIEERVVSPDIGSWSYPEVVAALEDGRVAMAAPMWNAALADIKGSDSPHAENINVALVPGHRNDDGSLNRVSFQHGWALVVTARSDNAAAAEAFIAYATGTDGGRIYALSGGGTPARRSVLGNPEVANFRPEFALVLRSLSIARTEEASPRYGEIHAVMNNALSLLVSGQLSAEEAMIQANQQIAEISGE